jgi:hypothetical protein
MVGTVSELAMGGSCGWDDPGLDADQSQWIADYVTPAGSRRLPPLMTGKPRSVLMAGPRVVAVFACHGERRR